MSKHIPASHILVIKSIFQSAYWLLVLCISEGGKGHVTPLTTQVQPSWRRATEKPKDMKGVGVSDHFGHRFARVICQDSFWTLVTHHLHQVLN